MTFTVATTRRVFRYTITREGTETIEWAHGTIETERWHRSSDDGKTDAYVWLAPSLRYIPVKMRVSNTARGTVEVCSTRFASTRTRRRSGATNSTLPPARRRRRPKPHLRPQRRSPPRRSRP